MCEVIPPFFVQALIGAKVRAHLAAKREADNAQRTAEGRPTIEVRTVGSGRPLVPVVWAVDCRVPSLPFHRSTAFRLSYTKRCMLPAWIFEIILPGTQIICRRRRP